MTHDVNTWSETTMKMPPWMASVEQVADTLRALFPEDAIRPYQQRVAEAGIREALRTLRYNVRQIIERRDDLPNELIGLVEHVLGMIDPDHSDYDGFFPSKLVCPHHNTQAEPAYPQMKPVMSPCEGYPFCKAGVEIRETRR